MHLHKLFLTQNACYQAGRTIAVKGIMVHSTGANNPYLKRYVGPDDGLLGKNQYNNHWNTYHPGGVEVCVHGFIGKLADGTVATYQTLPWNMRGWHAGGSANNTHIGFEICEDDLTDRAYFDKVYKEAVELCAYLCKEYGLTEKNIICHSEGYKLGVASNHGDVMHWFPKHGKNMDTFRADVKALLGDTKPAEVIPPKIDKKGDFTVEMRLLKNGTTGEDVKALQILLTGRGFGCGNGGADGIFGPDTEKAVRAYQKAKGLSVDGVAGHDTMTALLGT